MNKHSPYAALTNIGADFYATPWSNLLTVSLPALTKTSSLRITGNFSLRGIAASKLQSTPADVSFPGNFVMTTLDLSSLQTIGGAFHIDGSPSLPDLSGFKALTAINGDFDLGDLDQLADISGLKGLQKVGGDLMFQNRPSLTDDNLSGFSGLKTVGRDVVFTSVPFKTFSGFAATQRSRPFLRQTGRSMTISMIRHTRIWCMGNIYSCDQPVTVSKAIKFERIPSLLKIGNPSIRQL